MERINITPRQNWSTQIEALGFDFYHIEGVSYWHESSYYKFSAGEIDMFEAAANTLHQLCLRAIERIVSEKLYPIMGIERSIGEMITKSWENRDPCVYGRFDLLYDGSGPPKLLEYNADTPSSLFEASIVQWNWWEQVFPKGDQFNSIHESLIDRWKKLLVGRWLDDGRGNNVADKLFCTTAAPHPEDVHTVQYMGQLAIEAGFKMEYFPIQEMGWNGANFTNLAEQPIRQMFKLYPWEWLLADTNGWTQWQGQPANFEAAGTIFFEPKWKMLLSNKGLLPILWELFPEHENLLPAYRTAAPFGDKPYVQKPLLGREGCNITIRDGGKIIQQTEGSYGSDSNLPGHGVFIYQGFGESQVFEGNIRPNLGVWMANDKACGMGVREDSTLVMTNGSRFVPHIFS